MLGRSRAVSRLRFAGLSLALVLLAGLAGLAGSCASPAARVQKAHLATLGKPLNALGEAGDVDAMRVIADIEVLRGQKMFSDSLANALNRLPGSDFLGVAPDGKFGRVERGSDITAIVLYAEAEPRLLKEGIITPQQVAEIRRLITDNIAAAADMIDEVTGGPVRNVP